MSCELTENHPERVVKHKGTFMRVSSEKEAIYGWKTIRAGQKSRMVSH